MICSYVFISGGRRIHVDRMHIAIAYPPSTTQETEEKVLIIHFPVKFQEEPSTQTPNPAPLSPTQQRNSRNGRARRWEQEKMDSNKEAENRGVTL